MPLLPSSTSMATRKRTRSTNVTEQQTTSTNVIVPPSTTVTSVNVSSPSVPTTIATTNGPPKRQRNNPPPPLGPPPPVPPRTNYSFRNRSLTPDPRHPLTRFPSVNPSSSTLTPITTTNNRQRYNLRARRPQSQIRLPQVPTPHPPVTPRRVRRPIPPIAQTTPLTSSSTNIAQTPLSSTSSLVIESSSPLAPSPPPSLPSPITVLPDIPSATTTLPTPPVIQPRQYRLVYISDDDDEQPTTTQQTATIINTLNLVTDDEDDEPIRPQVPRRRLSRTTPSVPLHTRSRTVGPSSATSTSSSSSSSSSSSLTTINTQDFISGVAHVRLNRAIEIVIDSIQSLEGAVNDFDQLVFGLIYGRLGTRTEFESIEGMIRLSRILNLNLPARLTQDEIDSLPKIIFINKPGSHSSILLAEKCPICLTEFDDQETINKLHCTHLFHLQCISTWLSENDSCPTCRRKVMGD